mmetsp:Transcript_55376/g.177647  ORF Transcript_55376/g.177647 Transcript_55376/m.177647 type:complete len:215 (+) Transcript_55376:822-1466(+)
MAFDHRAVRDDVGRNARLLHVVEHLSDTLHVATSRASVHDRVVGHHGLHALALHLRIDGPNTLPTLRPREALQHGAIYHGVQGLPALLIFLHLVNELVGTLRVSVADDRLHHAAEGDACGPDVPGPHLLPTPPNPVNVAGCAVGLDEAAESVRTGNCKAVTAAQLLQLAAEELWFADPDTCLHDRREQHLIHGLLHGADQVHGLHYFGLLGVGI